MWLPPRAVPLLFLLPLVAAGLSPGHARAAPCVASPAVPTDIGAGAGVGSSISEPVDVNGTLFFAADDGVSGRELWKSSGTPVALVRVKDLRPGPPSSSPEALTAVGSTLFFLVPGATSGVELWRSDGTDPGTVLLRAFPAMANTLDAQPTAVGSTLFFVADDGGTGLELWKSDGTPGGTVLVKDIWPQGDGSLPLLLRAVGNQLFFKADDGSSGYELWKSDGTAQGTLRVEDLAEGGLSGNPGELTAVGQTLYFSATSLNNSTSLWRSDGTEEGTVLIRDFGDATMVSLGSFTAVGSTLFLQVQEPEFGEELWKSDGTPQGTRLVKDIQPNSTGSSPSQLTAVGSTLFFVANDGVHGLELWRSDGTAAGTRMVKDLVPGSGNPDFGLLEPGPGVLLLRVNDLVSGAEPWRSDGTAEGTYRLADVVPGSGASTPSEFRTAGQNLFFVATSPSLGEELFVVPLTQVDCTDPQLSCPTVNVEAISDQGTLLDYPPVVVTDDALFGLSVGFSPFPGRLPLGSSTVNAVASDLAGNASQCSFNIIIGDTTKPLLLCPEEVEQEATSSAGAMASYFVVATDAVTDSRQLTMEYDPPPGSLFTPGTRTVRAAAIDAAGNRSECSFPLTVSDTRPPRLRCPPEVFEVATREEELAVSYTVEAEDTVGLRPLSANYSSGATFPLGDTPVTVTASDTAGNTTQCTFTVHLVDPEGPSITCPGPQFAQGPGGEGVGVNFPEATATDNLGTPAVSYSHQPGSTFPEGVTEVTATASDLGGQTASCTFTVTVERGGGGAGGSSCQAGPWGGSLGWLLLVLIPVWARRRAERLAR